MKDSVLITGANRGLGRGLSYKFAKEGHDVLLHGKNDNELNKLKNQLIKKYKINCDTISVNLKEIERISSISKSAENFGVKLLINNAGIQCPSISLEDYSIHQMCEMIDVNLKAPIILTQQIIKNLNDIININSMIGLEVKKGRTLYSATKWGLRGFSNSLKESVENLNILDVYPTNIKTTPEKKHAMKLEFVCDEIYKAYNNKKSSLILDGRKM